MTSLSSFFVNHVVFGLSIVGLIFRHHLTHKRLHCLDSRKGYSIIPYMSVFVCRAAGIIVVGQVLYWPPINQIMGSLKSYLKDVRVLPPQACQLQDGALWQIFE